MLHFDCWNTSYSSLDLFYSLKQILCMSSTRTALCMHWHSIKNEFIFSKPKISTLTKYFKYIYYCLFYFICFFITYYRLLYIFFVKYCIFQFTDLVFNVNTVNTKFKNLAFRWIEGSVDFVFSQKSNFIYVELIWCDDCAIDVKMHDCVCVWIIVARICYVFSKQSMSRGFVCRVDG